MVESRRGERSRGDEFAGQKLKVQIRQFHANFGRDSQAFPMAGNDHFGVFLALWLVNGHDVASR